MRGWVGRNLGALSAALLALAVLVPFLNKPFHIDDPLFLWTADRIRQHPRDFYGYDLNWYGKVERMSGVTKNPPLTCYYLAAASHVVGWSEAGMHAAMLLPAMGLATGTYLLAQRMNAPPQLAAAATVLAPGVLISATNIMCDVMMLCFFVWAVYWWVVGVDEKRFGLMLLAAVAASAAAMTKYFGMSLVPLMLAYAIVRTRGVGWWLVALIVPIVVLAGYQVWTARMYGRGLLFDAMNYSAGVRWGEEERARLPKFIAALSFTGGCCATVALAMLFAAARWSLWLGVTAASALLFVVMWKLSPALAVTSNRQAPPTPLMLAQLAVWTTLGAGLLVASVVLWWKQRDAHATLLLLWILGTFVFAAFLNWSVAGRVIMPMIPAAAVLVLRHPWPPALREGETFPTFREPVWGVAIGAVIALCATWADTTMAQSAVQASRVFQRATADAPGTRWFLGHWGFQWYMEHLGFRHLDATDSTIEAGETLCSAANNANAITVEMLKQTGYQDVPVLPFASTMDLGAGFYTDLWGPLPFAFGHAPPHLFAIYEAPRRIRFAETTSGGGGE